jgi:hypothetical protein
MPRRERPMLHSYKIIRCIFIAILLGDGPLNLTTIIVIVVNVTKNVTILPAPDGRQMDAKAREVAS